jgi:hypothetical protein
VWGQCRKLRIWLVDGDCGDALSTKEEWVSRPIAMRGHTLIDCGIRVYQDEADNAFRVVPAFML